MMIYLDTNVLVYSYISPDDQKQIVSSQLIETLIRENILLLSPLVMQELIFVLNKLQLTKPEISDIIELFKKYCRRNINKKLVLDAYELCLKVENLKHINDAAILILTNLGATTESCPYKYGKYLPIIGDFRGVGAGLRARPVKISFS